MGDHCEWMGLSFGWVFMSGLDKDLVTLSPSLSITNKSFGVASSTNGMDGSYDGILCVHKTHCATRH